MKGDLFIYESAKKLCAFESGPLEATTCVVVIGGLTDGLLSLPYVPALSERLEQSGISTVQVVLSSSYASYGICSLAQDSRELTNLIEHLQGKRNKKEIILLGHSTGCQDILWFLQHDYDPLKHPLKFAMLQGCLSDRDFLVRVLPNYGDLLNWSQSKCSAGCQSEVYPKLIDGIPMTAYRMRSLLERLGDDDYFSRDLTPEERRERFSCLVIPTYVIFSGADEYAFDHENLYADLKVSFEHANPLIKVLPVISDANHGFSGPAHQEMLIDYVICALQKHSTMYLN